MILPEAHAGSVSLSTYYPPPQAAYDRVQLIPQSLTGAANNCNPATEQGILRYKSNGNLLVVCSASGTYIEVSGVWTRSGDYLYPTDTATNPNLKIGIGTQYPEYELTINNGGIYSSGELGAGVTLTTTGAGTRLIWYPRKAAFRAGRVGGDQWNDANIANNSAVGGGLDNMVTGVDSAISGGSTNAITAAVRSVIGGGQANTISGTTNVSNSVISGGQSNQITATGTQVSSNNVIGGGFQNQISGNTANSVIAGGKNNQVSGSRSVITGGEGNIISSDNSFIGGGAQNTVAQHNSAIGGGNLNQITNPTPLTSEPNGFIGGGQSNILADSDNSGISGGRSNSISTSSYSVILGGKDNSITGVNFSSIWGGLNNRLFPGAHYSAIMGGSDNSSAAEYSVVGGMRMQLTANADRSFVWGHNTDPTKYVDTPDAFILYNSAVEVKVGLNKAIPVHPLDTGIGAHIKSDGSICTAAGNCLNPPSDHRLKGNIRPLSGMLAKLLQLQGVTFQWNELSEYAADQEEHLGLIAQEVEVVFPEWVSENPDGYKTLDLRKANAPIVEGIRELDEDLTAARANMESSLAEIESLAKKIRAQNLAIEANTKRIHEQQAELERLGQRGGQ